MGFALGVFTCQETCSSTTDGAVTKSSRRRDNHQQQILPERGVSPGAMGAGRHLLATLLCSALLCSTRPLLCSPRLCSLDCYFVTRVCRLPLAGNRLDRTHKQVIRDQPPAAADAADRRAIRRNHHSAGTLVNAHLTAPSSLDESAGLRLSSAFLIDD